MTTVEMMRHQIEDGRFQLEKVLAGLTADQWQAKLTDHSFTPLQVAKHLCECYTALAKSADGETHEWGSYSMTEETPAEVEAAMFALRTASVEKALAKGDESAFKHLSEFVVMHDSYHVGQLAALRMTFNDGWDPYSIYNM